MGKILLTGAKGQLGQTFLSYFVQSSLAEEYTLIAPDRSDMDLSKRESISNFLSGCEPSVIINCGAYTAVDDAEAEFELAKRINDDAVEGISIWAVENDCRLIQVSTDFVFDGSKKKPYSPQDVPFPTGAYGRTKLAGEEHILKLIDNGVIIRTSWLYSEFRHNFLKTMLKLMSEKTHLDVVNNQVGSPTSTHSLVQVLLKVIEFPSYSGILHWCDGASISWYDFALEIRKIAFDQGLIKREIPLRPILSEDYPSKTKRPSYSVLDRSYTLKQLGMMPTSWETELEKVIERISKNQRVSLGA